MRGMNTCAVATAQAGAYCVEAPMGVVSFPRKRESTVAIEKERCRSIGTSTCTVTPAEAGGPI